MIFECCLLKHEFSLLINSQDGKKTITKMVYIMNGSFKEEFSMAMGKKSLSNRCFAMRQRRNYSNISAMANGQRRVIFDQTDHNARQISQS